MRVLVLTTTFKRGPDDPMPSFVYDLCKGLHKIGHEIIVLTPHCEGLEKIEFMDNIKVYRFPYFFPTRFQRLINENGILPNIKSSYLAKIQLPLLFLAELFSAFAIVKNERIDVIHSHWIVPNSLVGAICQKRFGIKHVLTEHAGGLAGLEKIPSHRKVLHYIIENSEGIICVSSYIRDKLQLKIQSAYAQPIQRKISIIPMGVPVQKYQNSRLITELKNEYNIHSKNILLFIGRIVDKKGVHYLVDAMSEILTHDSDTELLICGDGPKKRILQKQVQDLGLSEKIRFLGRITEPEKTDLLSVSDILIVPSITTQDNDTEGLPVVILEGLSAGKCIIASDAGGIRDAIKNNENGFLIEPQRSDLISKMVICLLNNPDIVKSISVQAKRSALEYDWDKIAQRYAKELSKNDC